MRTVISSKLHFIAVTVLLVTVLINGTEAYAQLANVGELPHPLGVRYASADTANAVDTVHWMPDTTCSCHASLPLEILASSIVWGIPAYWGYRGAIDDTEDKYIAAWPALAGLSIFLPLLSLAPVANWTSGCEASWWHAAWIGFGSNLACTVLYDLVYGHDHILNYHKINWPEYAALGVAPTIIASLVYNQFLHPRMHDPYGHNQDQGMYLLPSVGWDRSLALNFGMRF